jgi:hypothetical protein
MKTKPKKITRTLFSDPLVIRTLVGDNMGHRGAALTISSNQHHHVVSTRVVSRKAVVPAHLRRRHLRNVLSITNAMGMVICRSGDALWAPHPERQVCDPMCSNFFSSWGSKMLPSKGIKGFMGLITLRFSFCIFFNFSLSSPLDFQDLHHPTAHCSDIIQIRSYEYTPLGALQWLGRVKPDWRSPTSPPPAPMPGSCTYNSIT